MGSTVAGDTTVPPHALDDTDRRLLMELVADGRASHRDLAERTRLSLATVNRHVRRMEAEGTIRGYAALLDPERLGWGLTAVIGLRIEKGHVRRVHEAIAKDPRIFGVYDITGEWDGLVLVRLRDREDLDDLVKGTLSLEHIQRTTTMVVLKTVLEKAVAAPP
jgi:DNA-binding Lrp family transcriptional regulator